MTEEESTGEERKKEIDHLKRILASGYVNFLFGAGVNGDAFPNMKSGFQKTKNALSSYGCDGIDIEKEISSLDKENADIVLNTFISEFNNENIKRESESYSNLKGLLTATYNLINQTENRQTYTNKVNIFTLNYDRVVENILDQCGYLFHSISASDRDAHAIQDIIGYDLTKKGYVPTFTVSKLHGSAGVDNNIDRDGVILPNTDKMGRALSKDFFKMLFKMKSELERRNAIIFIIGYSGADDDVNSILKESEYNGLTIYWLKHSEKDVGLEEQNLKLIKIPCDGTDSTRVLGDMFNEVMQK